VRLMMREDREIQFAILSVMIIQTVLEIITLVLR